MVKKVGLAVLLALTVLVVYVGGKSADYEVSREVVIQASPEQIFPYLNNTKLGDSWGPWKEVEPTVAMNFSGPEEGVGAKTSWQGGKQLGTGSATIVESIPYQRVSIKLEYTDPMSMTQDSDYLITPGEGQSIVTWRVRGQNSFIGRFMCMFVNMDDMVGGMFEKGLGNLKQIVETAEQG